MSIAAKGAAVGVEVGDTVGAEVGAAVGTLVGVLPLPLLPLPSGHEGHPSVSASSQQSP